VTSVLRRIFGKRIELQGDGLPEVRARLDELKSRGGPEIEAHSHCSDNRDALTVSEAAGCFYCCEVFQPSEIDVWVDDGRCAICPRCGIDSVIGTASGFPVADVRFLEKMREIWF
jgi:hypothetical protein